MSKELFILFVYDTKLCQREEDDPQDAVLYFYPSWVTDQQRLALCGQLMGATQFYLTAFSCPRIISLNSGKFVIQQYGRYLIAVGTDRNVPDWVVNHRANTLHSLLQLYHKDLDTIYKNTNLIGTSFKEKLSQIFETYLPILQYAVDVFGTIPTIRLPKSASNVFLEAIQILHCCQEKKGVLGGAVLYQNRVVATQLHADLTKSLVSTDPYRIKSPAESVSTTFHLPVGVQLMKVYIGHKEYTKLFQEASSARASFESIIRKKHTQKRVQNALGKVSYIPKEAVSGMKRDISRIFTVPEEDGEVEQLTEDRNIPSLNCKAVDAFANQKSDDAFICSSNCTTPMKDISINKVLHERVVSICRVSESEEIAPDKVIANGNQEKVIPHVVKDTSKVHTTISKSKKTPHFLLNHTDNPFHRCQSMADIQPHTKLASIRIPLRSYSFGLPRLTRDLLGEDSDKSHDEDLPCGKHFYNTITDPCYPVFRCDGLPISRSLYDEHLAQHYNTMNAGSVSRTSPESKPDKLQGQLIPLSPAPTKTTDSVKPMQVASEAVIKNIPQDVEPTQGTPPSKQELYRRSLSLPLKNLTSEPSGEDTRRKSTTFPAGALESPSVRTRMMGTLPLTPLMAKLSSLAMDEKSNGFYSRETTPSEFRDFGIPTESSLINVPPKVNKNVSKGFDAVESESEKNAAKTPERAVLYVFGQQSMALLLLLEEELSSDPELIHSLWQLSVGSLNRLECHLAQSLDHCAQGGDTEAYSYICLDPRWDMLQRGGPWGCLELDLVASLHHDFAQDKSLTEIVARCEDSTVYGYQCGKTEVFYQQSSGATVGLPTPSDLMGVMALKARRRLERDHGIVLL